MTTTTIEKTNACKIKMGDLLICITNDAMYGAVVMANKYNNGDEFTAVMISPDAVYKQGAILDMLRKSAYVPFIGTVKLESK